jgi:MSHA pilin protein MshC
VELGLVIVILAVLAAMAAPRFFGNQVFAERGYYDELAAAVRYAQKVAVATGCRVRVDLDGSGYALSQQAPLAGHCDPADAVYPVPVVLGNGQVMNGVVPAGVAVVPALSFVYDALGRTDLAADQPVTVGTRAMVIQAESGLVVTP